jgi:hypothetical protein
MGTRIFGGFGAGRFGAERFTDAFARAGAFFAAVFFGLGAFLTLFDFPALRAFLALIELPPLGTK